MKGGGPMDSALIVSNSEKSSAFFRELLTQNACGDIQNVHNCAQARRLMIERQVDLCIINAPLPDESGIELAESIAQRGETQVMLLVQCEHYDDVCQRVESQGVFTLSRPLNRAAFWSALKLINAAQNRIAAMQNRNQQLLLKIEDIRAINRAKCLLIEYLRLSETQAHKYIERQAMDMRTTRREVADDILKMYDS